MDDIGSINNVSRYVNLWLWKVSGNFPMLRGLGYLGWGLTFGQRYAFGVFHVLKLLCIILTQQKLVCRVSKLEPNISFNTQTTPISNDPCPPMNNNIAPMPTQNRWAWVGMGIGTQCRALKQIYDDEALLQIRVKIRPPLILLWLLNSHLCWLLEWIHRSSQLCSLLSVE